MRIRLLPEILKSKNKNLAALLFIDLSKAFDSVYIKLFLKKIENLGIRGPALKLLKSYLTNRSQFTTNGKINSELCNIEFGTPQGSILSPLLFNLFLNDIVNLPLKGNLILYADDICVSYINSDKNTLVKSMQTDLDTLSNWFKFNFLSMNNKKTKFMIISPSINTSNLYVKPIIDNIEIEKVSVFKYLGLQIDENLKWTEHINFIKNKIKPIIGILWRVSKYTSIITKKKIYYALIHSHLNYLVSIWGSAYKSHLKSLSILQNKSLKIVHNLPWRHNTIQLYADTKILNINNLNEKNLCILIFQITNNLIKGQFNIILNNQIHTYATRVANHIHIDFSRTNMGKFSSLRKAVHLYNCVPAEIKSAPNLIIFKKLINKFYINNQCHRIL